MRYYSAPRRALRGVRQLLYPRRCPFCNAVLGSIRTCPDCAEEVDRLRRKPGIRLDASQHYLGGLSGAAAPFRYEGCVRRAILRAKYQAAPWTAVELGVVLAELAFGSEVRMRGAEPVPQRVEGARLGYDCIVPVPASSRRRGYNVPERMANIKFIAVSRSLSGILDYVTNREKTVERLISGDNCMAQTAQDEFEAVKKQFRKTDGRSYYHIVQAFAPDDPLDFDTAHEIGLKFAEYFKGYQCVVVTHMNTAHIHNHIIMNSVNFENGQKFHQSAREMQQAKEYSNQLCREYGLSFTESKADPFRIPAWKKRLCRTIKEAMENCATREEFIAFMAEYGYKVRWEANQKYITYTTPENVRCRDNKLFDQTLLRSSMEAYFDMGGCEYLESRIDATEYGELLPTVDDAVCGLISILDAMNTGDNDRFHLETLHHSKQEIRRILERGGKIDRTVEYAVDDEDEEYEQYHGFSMRM